MKDNYKEIKDFVDKLTGKKEMSLIDELLDIDTMKHHKKPEHKDVDEFDSAEEFSEEYEDDFYDEDEAMDEYDDEK